MGILLWYPVLVPQISGGLKPLIPVTANLSLHVPIGVVTANPDIVAKSSLQTSMIVCRQQSTTNTKKVHLSWQMLSLALFTVKVQVVAAVGRYPEG